ncbi:MAG: DUF4625 domain-containing protein [Bacteroidales bacterium]|nr:DUF4625 domain-containing protein [Bacteroidales bacterium]
MKTNILFRFLAIITLVAGFAACQKNPSAPKITLTEVGHENGGKAEQGDDLHLEADIVAEGLIQRIHVEIHQENGSYEIEKSYTTGKYIGVKNTEFHEHIDIPADAPLGAYHLHLTVTDKEGRTATVKAHLEVIENDGIDDEEEHHHHED